MVAYGARGLLCSFHEKMAKRKREEERKDQEELTKLEKEGIGRFYSFHKKKLGKKKRGEQRRKLRRNNKIGRKRRRKVTGRLVDGCLRRVYAAVLFS